MHEYFLFLFQDILSFREMTVATSTVVLSAYLNILLPVYLDWINVAMYMHEDLNAAQAYLEHAAEAYHFLYSGIKAKENELNELVSADFLKICAEFLENAQQLLSQWDQKNKGMPVTISDSVDIYADMRVYAVIDLMRREIFKGNFDAAKFHLECANEEILTIKNEIRRQGYQVILSELSLYLQEQIRYAPIAKTLLKAKEAISDKKLDIAKEYLNAAAILLNGENIPKDIKTYYGKKLHELFLQITEDPLYANLDDIILRIGKTIQNGGFDGLNLEVDNADALCSSIQEPIHRQHYIRKLKIQIGYTPIARALLEAHKALSNKNLDIAKECLNVAAKLLNEEYIPKDIKEHYDKKLNDLFLQISEAPLYAHLEDIIFRLENAMEDGNFEGLDLDMKNAEALCARIQEPIHKDHYKMKLEIVGLDLEKAQIEHAKENNLHSESEIDENLEDKIKKIELVLKALPIEKVILGSPAAIYQQFFMDRVEKLRLQLGNNLLDKIKNITRVIRTLDPNGSDKAYREALVWELENLHQKLDENRIARIKNIERAIQYFTVNEPIGGSPDSVYKQSLEALLLQSKGVLPLHARLENIEQTIENIEEAIENIKQATNNPNGDLAAAILNLHKAELLCSAIQDLKLKQLFTDTLKTLRLELEKNLAAQIIDKIKNIQQIVDGSIPSSPDNLKDARRHLTQAQFFCSNMHYSKDKEAFEKALETLKLKLEDKKCEYEAPPKSELEKRECKSEPERTVRSSFNLGRHVITRFFTGTPPQNANSAPSILPRKQNGK